MLALYQEQEDCFANIIQDFLVCTTIHKARQLGVFQGETYVRVTLDKMSRHTKVFADSENPYFNEYFVFEIKCTLGELLRLTILYEVKKRTACKRNPTLGELVIDMQSVWHQRNRCYFKKWGRLEVSIDEQQHDSNETKGFLQIDLAIVSQASNVHMLMKPNEDGNIMSMNLLQINQDYDDIEKNLLENFDIENKCNIRYSVIFYSGIMSYKSNYLVQFRFHNFRAKTSVAKNTSNPMWNQEINFNWIYPSLVQTLLIQLMAREHLQWKCVAEYEIHLEEIAFKDTPTLGPTYINFYDNLNSSQYVGRLLLELRSECLESPPQRNIRTKTLQPLDENRYWDQETFIVEFLALQGDFLQGNASNCKIHFKLAEHVSNKVECFPKTYAGKKSQNIANQLKYFGQESPYKAITLRIQLPDNRRKFECENILKDIIEYLKQEMETFKLFRLQYGSENQSELKVLREIIKNVMDKIRDALEMNRFEYRGSKKLTQWDVNRLLNLQDYFINLLQDLKMLRSRLKTSLSSKDVIDDILQELFKSIQKLQNLLVLNCIQDEWPDLILVYCISNKAYGFCRLNAKSFLYPCKDCEDGKRNQCWKVRNFIFKDAQCQHTCNNCGCVVAILFGCLSVVSEKERSDFLSQTQSDWHNPEPFYWSPIIPYTNFKCHIFIHQAKIRPGADRNGLSDPYVRVMIGFNSSETQVMYATLSPIWNTMISFEGLTLPGYFRSYNQHAPLLVLELYDTDKNTADDYLGCGFLAPTVITNDWTNNGVNIRRSLGTLIGVKTTLDKYKDVTYLSPPPLKWVPISQSGTIRAEILMSAELVETADETDMKAVREANITIGIPASIRPNMKNYVFEVIFAGLRNYSKSSIFSGRHRVKVMMADLMLTSGLSTRRLKSSINFLVSYSSGVVSLPDQLEYWPAIIATDNAVSFKAKETTLGAVLISNSKRYLLQHKELRCMAVDFAAESDIEIHNAFTIVNVPQDDNSEMLPLLAKQITETIWQRFSFNKKSNEKDALDLSEVMDEHEFNWWTKFYNSGIVEGCGALSRFKHKVCIYGNELEKQSEFSYFKDWAEPYQLVHGVKNKKSSIVKEEVYATLKMKIKITPCQCDDSAVVSGTMLQPLTTTWNLHNKAQLQSLAELVRIVVRVYIVQGLQFRPFEKSAQTDSYVKIQLGQKSVTNRAHHVPNDSNPIFGQCFQLEALLPREHIMEVTLFNRGSLHDQIIGSTYIDVEDRWRSKHRATVGIQNEFCSFGYNKWRDVQTPKQILNELCIRNVLQTPHYKNNIIEIDGFELEDETEIAADEDLQQRLSLTALKNLQHLPSFGYKLVPEHVETRSLYRYNCPGIEQGKIQLWLELYDGNVNIPPAIDITPQPPQMYELRVVIFGVSDVVLDERNIFGDAMSDIYIKGWCSNPNESQTTDIHYRSMDGEGKFNWRMIFPIKYSSIEDMMVIKRKSGLLEQYDVKQPPKLSLQIWDDDIISQDDFLGSLEINLSNFPQPFETAKKCQLTPHDNLMERLMMQGPKLKAKNILAGTTSLKLLNIFRCKKVRGWFPVRGNIPNEDNKAGLAGKIDLELELLTEKEAATYPVGLGRNPPNALSEPKRASSSFNPLTSPWRGFKQIVAPSMGKYFFIIFALVLVASSIFLFIVNLPIILTHFGY